jgi:hypothetical protein
MIYDNLGVKLRGEEDIVLTGSIHQDNTPVLEQNYVEKMNANNGFSQKRMFRKIASIPVVAVMKANQDGFNLDDRKDLDRYLKANPGFMSVDYILSPRNSQVIMK